MTPRLTDADYAAIVKRYEDAGDTQNADIIRKQWEVARASANAHPRPAETRMDTDSAASASQVGAHRGDALITVRFNDLMTLARQIIAEQLDDCDEEFMAGRAHGIGSLHSEILSLARRSALEQAQVDPSPMCKRKTKEIVQRDGYRHTGYVLQRTSADRICVSDGGAVAWFTREEWSWLMFNRGHVEFKWPNPIGALPAPAVIPVMLAEEVLATVLWLYRRLPRGYGRPPTVEHPILALAKLTGIDVADCLAEREPDSKASNGNERSNDGP
ncbi:hypothetical protein [Massilia sp.]|uniref:hypothetical protein n=1 Tax=Massilia sp. TaxID=1882437 RepID=UPI00352C18A9